MSDSCLPVENRTIFPSPDRRRRQPDDISEPTINATDKHQIQQKITIKDLGKPISLVGLTINRKKTNGGLPMRQEKHVATILERLKNWEISWP